MSSHAPNLGATSPGVSGSDSDSDYCPVPQPRQHTTAQARGNPHDPDLRMVNSTSAIPRKSAEEGSWRYTQYVPQWMDPTWRDDEAERKELDWPITDGLMDRVRPALLAQDQMSNPTQYSQRFGIFPGRSDGRSRTSPTRAESRIVFKEGNIRTGKGFFRVIDDEAHTRGTSSEEFMSSERPDLQDLGPMVQSCVNAYQELLIDEYWQELIFGQLTMDEVRLLRSILKNAC